MAVVDVDGSSQFSAATKRSDCIHRVSRMNCRNDFGHDDNTINIVVVIIIIIIIIIITCILNKTSAMTPPELS